MRLLPVFPITIATLLLSLTLRAQYTPSLKNWSKTTIAAANTGKNCSWLSADEKLIIFYINLARLEPKHFADSIVQGYVDAGHNWAGNDAVIDLLAELRADSTMPVLVPDSQLNRVSVSHAEDIGQHGITGHVSSDGKGLKERLQVVFGEHIYGAGENCDFGSQEPFMMLMELLIDTGTPGYGHRENILSPYFKWAGVSIRKHSTFGKCCVMDFTTFD